MGFLPVFLLLKASILHNRSHIVPTMLKDKWE